MTDNVFDVVEALAGVAASLSITLPAMSYAWLLQPAGLTSVIVGPRTTDHLTAAIEAESVEIPDESLAAIDEIVPPGKVVMPQYGTDGLAWVPWGPHRIPWR